MTSDLPRILQIQRDCLDSTVKISDILRKAKVAATKLRLLEFLSWINEELMGYNCKINGLPDYRKGVGAPYIRHIYYGWQPIEFGDGEIARAYSAFNSSEPIGNLEELVDGSDDAATFMQTYPTEIRPGCSVPAFAGAD